MAEGPGVWGRPSGATSRVAGGFAAIMAEQASQSPVEPSEEPLSWTCDVCTLVNSGYISVCEACGTSKVQPDADLALAMALMEQEVTDFHRRVPYEPRRPTADPNEKVVVVQELEPRAELVGEHLRAYAALLESTASPEELQGGDVDDAEDDEELDEEEVEEYLNKRDVGEIEQEVQDMRAMSAAKSRAKLSSGRVKGQKRQANATPLSSALRSTREGVMDGATRLLFFKLVNYGTLQKVHGCVKTGKEASVYYCEGGARELEEGPPARRGAPPAPPLASRMPPNVAAKVFRTTLNEFGKRGEYVKGDHRYGRGGLGGKVNGRRSVSRRQVFKWTEKELRNLCRVHRCDIPCPQPFLARQNVLLMEFIGDDGWPAPQLKEIKTEELSARRWFGYYKDAMMLVWRLWHEADLVHADLSEYNLLLHQRQLYVIDFAQAVLVWHPKAMFYLARDLQRIATFFTGKFNPSMLLDVDTAISFVCGAGRERRGAVESDEDTAEDEEDAEQDEEELLQGISKVTVDEDEQWMVVDSIETEKGGGSIYANSAAYAGEELPPQPIGIAADDAYTGPDDNQQVPKLSGKARTAAARARKAEKREMAGRQQEQLRQEALDQLTAMIRQK